MLDIAADSAQSPSRARVLAEVCAALSAGARKDAQNILRRDYPYAPEAIVPRRYGPVECTRVFVRDGFVDRYTGDRLIFPPVLRVISFAMPTMFPFHPNWKTDVTHPAYWEVGATVDHVVPVTRGGPDDESNWVTTSMARNSAKQNWSLAELGWSLQPAGDVSVWDGLMQWFLSYTAAHPDSMAISSVRHWRRAAEIVMTAR